MSQLPGMHDSHRAPAANPTSGYSGHNECLVQTIPEKRNTGGLRANETADKMAQTEITVIPQGPINAELL